MPAAFRNDPVFVDVPRPGDGSALLAERHVAGPAVRYTGPEDDKAIIDFLGGSCVLVAGRPFREFPDGTLQPLAFRAGFIYVRPMAGDWYELSAHELTTEHSIVDEPLDSAVLDAASAAIRSFGTPGPQLPPWFSLPDLADDVPPEV